MSNKLLYYMLFNKNNIRTDWPAMERSYSQSMKSIYRETQLEEALQQRQENEWAGPFWNNIHQQKLINLSFKSQNLQVELNHKQDQQQKATFNFKVSVEFSNDSSLSFSQEYQSSPEFSESNPQFLNFEIKSPNISISQTESQNQDSFFTFHQTAHLTESLDEIDYSPLQNMPRFSIQSEFVSDLDLGQLHFQDITQVRLNASINSLNFEVTTEDNYSIQFQIEQFDSQGSFEGGLVSKAKIESLDRLENIESCSICLIQDEQRGLKLNCQHEFHASCILEWFNHASNCPLCRIKV